MKDPGTDPILWVEKLKKRFGGLTAVDEVSFSLTLAEILGIIGPNGFGKTTLFSLMSGYLPPDSGRVTLDGTDITKRRPAALARMGLLRTFQIVKPFVEMTVAENVVIAGLLGGSRPLSEARAIADEVLDLLGLTPMASRLAETLTIADRKELEVARGLLANLGCFCWMKSWRDCGPARLTRPSSASRQFASAGYGSSW